MKKKALVLCALLLLSVSILGFSSLAKANPVIPHGTVAYEPVPPSIEVESMQVSTEGIQLRFTVNLPYTQWSGGAGTSYGPLTSVRYILDSNERNLDLNKGEYGAVPYSISLEQPAAGEHVLTIIAEGLGYYGTATSDLYPGSTPSFNEVISNTPLGSSVRIIFTTKERSVQIESVQTHAVPSINILSPRNITYTSNSVSLNFTVNGADSPIKYSLNRETNVTVTGNTTLTGFTEGNYILTISTFDETLGIEFSSTAFFTINKEQEPLPITLLIVSAVAVVALVGVGLLVYLKERGRGKTQ